MKIIENKYSNNTFENIKHIDDYGNEYWYARELQIALDYKRWDKFCNVIESAKIACENSNNAVLNHFSQVGKMVEIGSGAKRKQMDFKLSRYACYLIVQNASPKFEAVALGMEEISIHRLEKIFIQSDETDSLMRLSVDPCIMLKLLKINKYRFEEDVYNKLANKCEELIIGK